MCWAAAWAPPGRADCARTAAAGPGAPISRHITIRDMVRAQKMLIDHLGIDAAVRGGRRLDGRDAGAAMGGELSRTRCSPRCRSPRAAYHSRAEHRLPRGRPRRRSSPIRTGSGGRYWENGRIPARAWRWRGWCAHITYLSEEALTRKFGRRLQNAPKDPARRSACSARCSRWRATCATRAPPSCSGSMPIRYLTITRAMDYFDLAADYDGDVADAFRGTKTRFCSSRSPPTGCSRPRRAAPSRGR